MNLRIGHGYDVHRLTEGRDLILGGIKIDHPYGLDGHSDADVLIHAICDALLGALGLGDLGHHFPDTDQQYKNISSVILLEEVKDHLSEKGFGLVNLDATLICEKPKLAPVIMAIRKNLGQILSVQDVARVNVKATTHEGLGALGRNEGIAAHAVVLLEKIKPDQD